MDEWGEKTSGGGADGSGKACTGGEFGYKEGALVTGQEAVY